MDRDTLIKQLNELIEEFLKSQGLELVEVIYRQEGRTHVLRIFADRPEGGITLEECSLLNREIGRMLEEKNILQEEYLLEVSSPGIDRPLRTQKDFARCINRRARFFLSEPVNGKIEWEGLIVQVGTEAVSLDLSGTGRVEIPLSKINKAKQEIY
ncbi:MAG: ribosome maturation factor RimP [Candidatus Omnitrophica bacterium]|nr:ribosome maturation factor RimP [Candidatus Omnitrophota bacterium]MDD5513131.1 ribosome maturation factor RimP [Candidatus Omnitrophota bacterium]